MWFPTEAWGAPRSRGKTDPWGRELGGLLREGYGEAPVPVPLPKDTEWYSGPGVPPPSCSEELSTCCL